MVHPIPSSGAHCRPRRGQSGGGFGQLAASGHLTLQFLSSGFSMLRFSNFFKEFIWGAVLLVVMVINYLTNTRRERREALLQAKECEVNAQAD